MHIEIEWMEGYSNDPRINIVTDEHYNDVLPPMEGLRFEGLDTGNGTFWVCEQDNGFVRFFLHNPRDQSGFGGAVFRFQDENGVLRTAKGPWSSRAGVASHMIGKPILDAALRSKHGLVYAAITLKRFLEIARETKFPYYILEGYRRGEFTVAVSTQSDRICTASGTEKKFANDGIVWTPAYDPSVAQEL